jgi:hypothetical protein
VARLVVFSLGMLAVLTVLIERFVCQLNSQNYRDSEMTVDEVEIVGCCG